MSFKSWINGEDDLLLEHLHTTTKEEDHVVPKLTKQEQKIENDKVIKSVYNVGQNRGLTLFDKVSKVLAVVFCLGLVATMLFTISYLPKTGDPDTPANSSVVAQRYIENGLEETGATNIVTGMILTYRAFDTFGETNVLFIATICVMVLLMMDEKILEKMDKTSYRIYEPKQDPILQLAAKVLCPIILLFGIYVILNGQLSPGGGFSGGAILGAAMILYNTAMGFRKTQKFFNENVYKVAKITALCMYGLIGTYFYLMGANGLDNHIPLGNVGAILSGGIILPIDIAVGIEVACTMYAFYALFRRGGL